MKRIKPEDFIGHTFGELTIQSVYKKNSRSYCHCLCSCGRQTDVIFSNLRTGNTTTCGDRKKHDLFYYEDLKDKQFGYLTVIEKTDKRASNKIIWKCKCECGNICEVRSDYLISHHTESCGCKVFSKGENKISEILTENKIPFIQQKTFKDCRFQNGYLAKFDFFVNNHYIIEYDGIQHFFNNEYGWNNKENFLKTKEHDKIKNEWCIKNNIPIIRIPYTKLSTLDLKDLLLDSSEYIVKEGVLYNAE